MKVAVSARTWNHIQIQRTPCFGSCPAYTLTLWRDGRATYSGNNAGAPRTGEYEGRVDLASYAWLCYLMDALHFEEFDPNYSTRIEDLPTTFVRAWREVDTEPVTVEDYGESGPLALWGIQREMDELGEEIAWTPVH